MASNAIPPRESTKQREESVRSDIPIDEKGAPEEGARRERGHSEAGHVVNITGDKNLVILDSDVQSTGSVPHATSKKEKQFIRQLKGTYSTLTGKVRPIPFSREKRTIDEVFTEVGIKCKPARANGKETTLNSYREIITRSTGQSRVQIVEGEPGYGKSILSLRLAHDWCIDESHVKNIDILIYLNLRQLRGTRSIYEAIVECLLPVDSTIKESDVEQLLQNEDVKTLILFDAHDEYPDKDIDGNFVSRILGGKLLQHVSVLLTTRSSCIPRECDGRTGRIKLTGFDGRAREEYVRKVVTRGDENATQKILMQMNTNSILADICQAPLFAVIYAHSAHEAEINIDFSSVTEFFGYMVNCFHYHALNKAQTEATAEEQAKFRRFKDNHDKLDKLSYEALFAENQQLTWGKDIFIEELGEEFYDRHIDIGILIEEEVLNRNFPSQPDPYKAEVRFFHKLSCEWYAAHHLVKRLSSPHSPLPGNLVDLMDPSDLQHVYRFACGLDPDAAPQVIELLVKKKDCDRLAVLCALEQKDKTADVLNTVRDLVSRDVCITGDDSRLLQRTTIELVELACKHGIRVSCLQLKRCFTMFDVTNSCIVLESDFRLANMKTVRVLHMEEHILGSERKITEEELLGLLQTCEGLKELRFDSWRFMLPLSIPPEMISTALRERNIHVQYDRGSRLVYRLSFEHGQWKIHDQRADQSLRVEIHQRDSQLEQEWCVQDLKMAAEAGVGIKSLVLNDTFDTVADEGQSITLTSALTIPVLQTLQELKIMSTDINLEIFVRILSYVKDCPQMTTLQFLNCQVPDAVDPGLIPPQLSRRRMGVFSYGGRGLLDLGTGRWKGAYYRGTF